MARPRALTDSDAAAVAHIYCLERRAAIIAAYVRAGRGQELRAVMAHRLELRPPTPPAYNSTVTLAAVFHTSHSSIIRALQGAGVPRRHPDAA